ncbi:MAG: hypothetical protein RLZZ535_3310 [Cyanobacteriota bacterium]
MNETALLRSVMSVKDVIKNNRAGARNRESYKIPSQFFGLLIK